MITITLYGDSSLEYRGDYGVIFEVLPNIFELQFVDQNLETKYILIDETGIYFCDEFGNIELTNDGNNGDGVIDGTNLDYTEFGYGYFNLTSKTDYQDMRTFYQALYDANLDVSSKFKIGVRKTS